MDASTEVATTQKPIEVVGELVRANAFELPLLPESSSKLLRLCDEHSSPEELAQCIRNDAAIATNVLRVANSAVYSSGTPIVSMQQAVARLGISRIREIVLVVSCKSRVFSVPGFEEEVQESFQNSLATGFFAQEIARVRRLSVEDAFLCGLLHDIGRPILLQAVFDYQRAQQVSFDRSDLIDAVEHFRPEVGGSLIEAWSLPERIVNLSYGEGSQLPNSGRVIQFAEELVWRHNIIFVSAIGNNGPALSTVNAPGGLSSCIFGVAAYISPDMMKAQYSLQSHL